MLCLYYVFWCWVFFFKQKTAYEMRISDWSSDVCSSDLQDRHVGEAPQAFELAFGERGAERGDGIIDPGARKRDHVHIAFDHEHAAGLAGSGRGAIEIVERAALVEQRGFGRIQIFGLAVADDAAAERDHAAARVADRDHQAAAEAIIGF